MNQSRSPATQGDPDAGVGGAPAEPRQALDPLVIVPRVGKGAAGVMPRAEQQMLDQLIGDIGQQQRGDDLVDPEAELEKGGNADPAGAGYGGGDEHERQAEEIGADVEEGDAGRGDAAQPHLALDADVPEPELERRRRCQADEHQRRRRGHDLSQAVQVEEHVDDELVDDLPGGDAVGDEDAEGDEQAERDPADERRGPHPERCLLAGYEIDRAEARISHHAWPSIRRPISARLTSPAVNSPTSRPRLITAMVVDSASTSSRSSLISTQAVPASAAP